MSPSPATGCSSTIWTMCAAGCSPWIMSTAPGGPRRSSCRRTRRSLCPAPPTETNQVMFTVTDYLNPPTLWFHDADAGGRPQAIKAVSAQWDSSRHVVEQLEATLARRYPHPLFPRPAARHADERLDADLALWLWRLPAEHGAQSIPARSAGSGWNRATPMSSPIFAAAASSARTGTRPRRARTSSAPGTIISPSPRI